MWNRPAPDAARQATSRRLRFAPRFAPAEGGHGGLRLAKGVGECLKGI
jgi:hypothetical protein